MDCVKNNTNDQIEKDERGQIEVDKQHECVMEDIRKMKLSMKHTQDHAAQRSGMLGNCLICASTERNTLH